VPPIINQIFSGAGTASSDGYSISIKRVQPAAGSLLISNTSGLMCGLVPVVATALADGALECEQIDTEEPRLFPAGVDLATHIALNHGGRSVRLTVLGTDRGRLLPLDIHRLALAGRPNG
jgi:hypothetical protein